MRKHTYVSAEKFILSREFFGMKLGLENIYGFLHDIGSPQLKYKTIHISGTNGKGSTASMLAAVFQENGYRTGLFTSPHLTTFRERVQVDGKLIPQNAVTRFIDRYRKVLSDRKLSFFELTTAMALDYFQRAKVDIAIIETGLGGRLDATNVLDPIMTITTGISRDHVEILGNSLTKIAREKAGIIKKDTPHILANLPQSVVKVFENTCHKREAPLIMLKPDDYLINADKTKFDFIQNGLNLKNITSALHGLHQINNTALVIKALAELRKNNIRLSWAKTKKALKNVKWAGRFQLLKKAGKPLIILDVSHNTEGMTSFINTFQQFYPDKKADIITGFVKRKEHQKMFDLMALIANRITLVPLKSHRSVDMNDIMDSIKWGKINVVKSGSLKTAVKKALKNNSSDDIIIIIGSHYLVGEFLQNSKSYGI